MERSGFAVFDTCAIIQLVDLTGSSGKDLFRTSLDWFTSAYLSFKVEEELYKKSLRSADHERIEKAYFAVKVEKRSNRISIKEVPSDCRHAIIKEAANVPKEMLTQRKSRLDPGEIDSAGLTLLLSRMESGAIPIFLVTGDFKAIPILEYVFLHQHAGLVLSTPEFLIWQYAQGRFRGETVKGYLMELSDIISEDFTLRQIKKREEYLKRLGEICRYNCREIVCSSQ